MFAKLTALVGGGPALNYTVDNAYPDAWGCWTHHAGVSKEDNTTKVSVFKIATNDPNDPHLIAARNGVKRLKLVRAAACPCPGMTTAHCSTPLLCNAAATPQRPGIQGQPGGSGEGHDGPVPGDGGREAPHAGAG